MRAIPDDNLSYPVLIELGNGSSGSGFYLDDLKGGSYFVTAKHVLVGPNSEPHSNAAVLVSHDFDPANKEPLRIQLDLDKLEIKKHPKDDVAVIKIATHREDKGKKYLEFLPGVKKVTQSNSKIIAVIPSQFRRYEDAMISNEVFVFGYPNSLGMSEIPQLDYSRPLLRRGIIAGKNDSTRTIILDCPIYYGNSGGLVLEKEEVGEIIPEIDPQRVIKNRFYYLGIVSQFVPFVERWKSLQYQNINLNFENSGYSIVVPIDRILELL